MSAAEVHCCPVSTSGALQAGRQAGMERGRVMGEVSPEPAHGAHTAQEEPAAACCQAVSGLRAGGKRRRPLVPGWQACVPGWQAHPASLRLRYEGFAGGTSVPTSRQTCPWCPRGSGSPASALSVPGPRRQPCLQERGRAGGWGGVPSLRPAQTGTGGVPGLQAHSGTLACRHGGGVLQASGPIRWHPQPPGSTHHPPGPHPHPSASPTPSRVSSTLADLISRWMMEWLWR